MTEAAAVIHFRDERIERAQRAQIEAQYQRLGDELRTEFPELDRLEITLMAHGSDYAASGHATGKSTELATHASAADPQQTLSRLLDKMRQQLRRRHDKRIFTRRREARRAAPASRP